MSSKQKQLQRNQNSIRGHVAPLGNLLLSERSIKTQEGCYLGKCDQCAQCGQWFSSQSSL